MFVSIIVGIIVLYFIVSLVALTLGEVIRRILEIASFIVKFVIGGMLALIVAQALSVEFTNPWKELACFAISGVIFVGLISLLSEKFRLICYSVNYFLDSIVVCVIIACLKNIASASFIVCAIMLFLLPRIIWAINRFTTSEKHVKTEYSFFSDIRTEVFEITDVDLYKYSEDSWRKIPFQIVIASVFYMIGSAIFLIVCPFEPVRLELVFVLAMTVINIVFDLFVFRKIDAMLTDKVDDYISSFPTK